MPSDRLDKLSCIGKAGQKIAVFGSSSLINRAAGTDTAECLKPRPVFPAPKPGKVFVKPCFPFLNTTVIFCYFGIFRLPEVCFTE